MFSLEYGKQAAIDARFTAVIFRLASMRGLVAWQGNAVDWTGCSKLRSDAQSSSFHLGPYFGLSNHPTKTYALVDQRLAVRHYISLASRTVFDDAYDASLPTTEVRLYSSLNNNWLRRRDCLKSNIRTLYSLRIRLRESHVARDIAKFRFKLQSI